MPGHWAMKPVLFENLVLDFCDINMDVKAVERVSPDAHKMSLSLKYVFSFTDMRQKICSLWELLFYLSKLQDKMKPFLLSEVINL